MPDRNVGQLSDHFFPQAEKTEKAEKTEEAEGPEGAEVW